MMATSYSILHQNENQTTILQINPLAQVQVDDNLVKYQTASGVILSIELKEPYCTQFCIRRVLFIQQRSRLKESYKQLTRYRLKSSNRRNINSEGYQRLYLRHVFIYLNSLNNVKIEWRNGVPVGGTNGLGSKLHGTTILFTHTPFYSYTANCLSSSQAGVRYLESIAQLLKF